MNLSSLSRDNGNILVMLWNAKTPNEDGIKLKQNAYIYHYDDFGQMTGANYAADDPAFPGEYNTDVGNFNESVEYQLGGTMRTLSRNGIYMQEGNSLSMDSLLFEYKNGGYKPMNIDDKSHGGYDMNLKHFVDGADAHHEYTYDAVGRTLTDKNKGVTFYYNRLGLPRKIVHESGGYFIEFTYDAAGNKLQKKFMRELTDTQQMEIVKKDYIGNFVYEQDSLALIYHPGDRKRGRMAGVIRHTPPTADNTTDYVYDYFIKDYLGNVRVVLTEEDATYTNKFLATMEEVYRQIEEDNFDGINETAEPLPSGYPMDGSVDFNARIAALSEATGTEIGPSIVLPVRRGDKISLSTRYFYKEVGEGTTYENMNMLVNEILMSLATGGAGVLRLNEAQLIDIAAGNGNYANDILNLLSNSFDTTDVSKPHSYMVWMLYDNNMRLIPEGSGAKRVTNPNQLGTLIEEAIPAETDGYLHCFVSNEGIAPVNFDNFLVTYLQGKTRQINHYYPYGLSISGIDGDYDDYLNKYTAKELQTGEFGSLASSSGLEMFDFHARFYDPQLGRWFTPDPAEQFANPYLAMGNNPVVYVDPDGEFIWVAIGIGAAIGAYSGHQIGKANGAEGWEMAGYMFGGAVIGGLSGAAGYSVATSGMAFANTASIATGTFTNSVGMNALSGGETDVSIGFGVASYNISQNEWGYLGKKGNSTMENIGYSLGAFTNVSDAFTAISGLNGSNSSSIELQSDNHSSLHDMDDNTLLDVGVQKPRNTVSNKEGILGTELSVDYRAHQASLKQAINQSPFYRRQPINNVNIDKVLAYRQQLLDSGKGFGIFNAFGGRNVNCSFAASMGLLKGGVFNIPVGIPGFLSFQMYARQYSYMSYLLNDGTR